MRTVKKPVKVEMSRFAILERVTLERVAYVNASDETHAREQFITDVMNSDPTWSDEGWLVERKILSVTSRGRASKSPYRKVKR